MIKIPIRLYYTSDGELFTQGNLNNVPMLNRLSNYAYSLFLITPVKPYETLEESSEKATIVNVYFEKGDGTKTEQYPMAWVHSVPVKVRNTEEEWNVYKCDISDDVLTISSFEHDNTLGIGFSVKISTGKKTNDGEEIYQTLNYLPYYTSCNYTITGNARTYDDFTLDIITEYLNTMLKTKLNNIDGITKTSTLPTIYSDPNDVENYNVNKLFILTSIIEGYNIGDIIAITRTGSSSYGYIKIVNGADYIDKLRQAIEEIDEDILKLKTRTDSLEKNDESQDYTLLSHTQELLQISTIIELLNKNKIEIDDSIVPEWKEENVGKVFINTSDSDKKGLIYLVNVNSNVPFIYLNKSLSELNDINDDLISSLTRLGNVEEEILKLKSEKLNKIFSDLQLRNNIGDNSYLPIYVGDTAYRVSWSDLKKYIESGGSDHFKGDYVSYEQLVSSVLNPKDGDYAYVEVNENELTLYIWDTDDNIWRMSSAGQFLKESVFNLFQEQILNGTLPVGKAKDYTEDGEIGLKFSELEKQTIEFSDVVEEVYTSLQSYAKKEEVNQMIADYITTNFENFDEGEF